MSKELPQLFFVGHHVLAKVAKVVVERRVNELAIVIIKFPKAVTQERVIGEMIQALPQEVLAHLNQ